jgi:apolipoprotein N-acyltransferase
VLLAYRAGYSIRRPADTLAAVQVQQINQAASMASENATAGPRGLVSVLLSVAAGVALAAAFPPVGLWPLAMAGPALLTLAVWGKGRLATAGLALVTSVVFFVLLLTWLVNVAWYAWAALVALEAGLFTLAAPALRPLLRLRAWPLGVAGWWVAQEALRDRFPYGGVPWGRLVMSQAGAPTAGWAAIGGPPLVTFAVALAGTCVAYLAVTMLGWTRPGQPAGSGGRRPRVRLLAAGAALAATGIALAGGLVWQRVPTRVPSAIIAAVQGNVPHSRSLPKQLRETTVTANHADATIAFAAAVRAGRRPSPDVVIWPENSTDIDPSLSPTTYQTIAAAVAAIGRPVLVGAVLQNPLRNAGQLWLPGRGPVQVYVKRQLVPFGEVIPFRSLIDTFSSLPSLQPVNFTAGHRAVVFAVGKVRLGDVICWEVGFDAIVRSEVLAGANVLTVQTNDADFELDGQLGETFQQLAMARIDAISTGREVIVVSTTGVSAFVAPDGTVTAASRTWRRTVLEQRVPLETAFTPADRLGAWPELTIAGLTVLAALWVIAASLAAARKGRQQITPPQI